MFFLNGKLSILRDKLYKSKNWSGLILFYKFKFKLFPLRSWSEDDFAKYAIALRADGEAKKSLFILNKGQLYFPTSRWLKIELATLCIQTLKWDDSISIWRNLYSENKKLSALNFNRYARVCEELKCWDEYEEIVWQGVEFYSQDKLLNSRVSLCLAIELFDKGLFSQSLDVLVNDSIITKGGYSTSEKEVKKLIDKCCNKLPLFSYTKSNRSFLSAREDGLGERLNSLLTGLYLSKRLGFGFGVYWANELHQGAANLSNEAANKLMPHAITNKEDIFSKEFIDSYFIQCRDGVVVKDFSGEDLTKTRIELLFEKNSADFLAAPRLDIEPMLSKLLKPTDEFNYRSVFDESIFNNKIISLFKKAENVPDINNSVALHLRSGDVFFGEYRKFVHYSYKGITIPLAKKIIEDEMSQGKKVIVFGQDKDVLKYLRDAYGVVLANDLIPDCAKTSTEIALFEIKLMSLSNKIIAGSSGFAKVASWIGGKSVVSGFKYLTAKDTTEYFTSDLNNNSSIYPSLHSAFSYWYAYHYNRKNIDYNKKVSILEKAYFYDKDNEMYLLVLFFISLIDFKYIQAETYAHDIKGGFYSSLEGGSSFSSVLMAKTLSAYNLQEYFDLLAKSKFDMNSLKEDSKFIIEYMQSNKLL